MFQKTFSTKFQKIFSKKACNFSDHVVFSKQKNVVFLRNFGKNSHYFVNLHKSGHVLLVHM